MLQAKPGLRAIAIFEEMQRRHPQLPDCVRRTLERRIDRKSTRLNSSHAEISPLSLHDALTIYAAGEAGFEGDRDLRGDAAAPSAASRLCASNAGATHRSEEHTSELQSRRDLPSFPTRRSYDLCCRRSRV